MTTLLDAPIRPMRAYRQNYDDTPAPDFFVLAGLRTELYQRLDKLCGPLPKGAKVLDAGCGRQPLRSRIESLGLAYHSQDVIQNFEGTVQYLCPLDSRLDGDLSAAGPFDLIICTEVLEHVADWRVAYGNLASLLAPNGVLLISCPHFYVLHEEPFDFWRPTLHAIKYFAANSGLKVQDATTIGSPWEVLGTIIAHMKISPTERSLANRVAYRIARAILNGLYGAIRRGWMQRFVKAECPTYLTNVVELVKPAS